MIPNKYVNIVFMIRTKITPSRLPGCLLYSEHSVPANARSLTLTPSVGTDEQNTACLERHRPVRKRKVKNRQCTFLDQEI